MTTPAATQHPPTPEAVLDVLARLAVTRLGSSVEAEVRDQDRNTYRVRLDGDNWHCSCPAATSGVRSGEACKHASALRIVRATLPTTLGGPK